MINYYEWSSEKASSGIESCSQPILFVKGRAQKLTVVNGKATVTEIHELYSNQEETDIRKNNVPSLCGKTRF